MRGEFLPPQSNSDRGALVPCVEGLRLPSAPARPPAAPGRCAPDPVGKNMRLSTGRPSPGAVVGGMYRTQLTENKKKVGGKKREKIFAFRSPIRGLKCGYSSQQSK